MGWGVLGPTLVGLSSTQGAGQRVPVRGVWPGLPLPQRLAHEPCSQVLCVVSRPLPTHPHAPATLHELPPAGRWTQCWSPSGCHTPSRPLQDLAPCWLPYCREAPRAGMRLGCSTARGEMLGSPVWAPGSRALGQAGLSGPTSAVFLLLCLVNKAAALSPRPLQGPPEKVGLEGPLWEEVLALSTTGSLETFLSPSWGPWLSCLGPASPGSSVFSTNPPTLPLPQVLPVLLPSSGGTLPSDLHPSAMLDSLLELQSGTSPSPRGVGSAGPLSQAAIPGLEGP